MPSNFTKIFTNKGTSKPRVYGAYLPPEVQEQLRAAETENNGNDEATANIMGEDGAPSDSSNNDEEGKMIGSQ